MPRLRLIDCRLSRLPSVIGKCQTDVAEIAQAVNSAQQRLLYCPEAGDESWYGTWAEIRMNVARNSPFVTLPREIARLEMVDLCDRPIPVYNQFFEYLQFGNGRSSKHWIRQCHHPRRAAFSRNNAVLFQDITNAPQFIQIFATNDADTTGNTRVLIQGLDANGSPVYSEEAGSQILGEYVVLASPFASTKFQYSKITGIQKDVTQGPVQFFQLDPSTADQILLLTMEPTEQTASYRRYFFNNLPCSCCPPPGVPPSKCPPAQVTAIAKLELIPVAVDTDYLLIQNLEAIIEECQSARYAAVDNMASQQLAALHHKKAVGLLNGELGHYLGKNDPAVNFAPFGSAKLSHRRIGAMM